MSKFSVDDAAGEPNHDKPYATTKPGDAEKRLTGFSVAEDDWAQAIPKPGHYPATVVNSWINPRSGVVYLNIEYAIPGDDGRRFIVTDFLVLDAPLQDRQYTRSAEGKGRVKAIMEANSKPLQFSSIQAVPLALVGCRITIAVGHRDADGLPVPKVQGIVGPADTEEES
jgi:hypothetical protein